MYQKKYYEYIKSITPNQQQLLTQVIGACVLKKYLLHLLNVHKK